MVLDVLRRPHVDLTPQQRQVFDQAATDAPTLLESLFWGWLAGLSSAELYFEELAITDLWGPYNVPDDFPGEP